MWVNNHSLSLQSISYAQCETFWRYAGKVVIILRNLLNAAARSPAIVAKTGIPFSMQAKYIATAMKMFALVSVPFSWTDLKSISNKIRKCYQLDDKEGMALGTLSATIVALDIFDSSTTFINAALLTSSRESVPIFSTLGLPVGFAMASLGIISRTIQIAKACKLNSEINQFIKNPENNYQHLLISRLGHDSEKEKKKLALLRFASATAVQALETANCTQDLLEVQDYLKKKIKADLLAITGNHCLIFSQALFRAQSGGPLPFLLLAAGYKFKLLSVLYS